MDYIKLYLDEKRLSLSPKTIKSYTTVLRAWERYLTGLGKTVELADRVDVIAYINMCDEVRRLQRSSLSSMQRDIITFYGYMYENEYMPKDIGKKIPAIKVDRKAPVYLTMEEFATFYKTAAVNVRHKLMVELLVATGMRVSEFIGFRKQDIAMCQRTIQVFGKGSKQREVIYDEATARDLAEYIKDLRPGDRVFDLSQRTIERDITILTARSGINKHITPHKLRHTFATQMLQNGMDIRALQKLLGHESLNTTQLYTHYSTQELRARYDQVQPFSVPAHSA